MDKYKLTITVAYFGLAAIALVVISLIVIFRPDATATIIQFTGTILGIASTAAVTFYMLGKQNDKLEVVQKQTNGTLSKLTEENTRLTAELVKANRLINPDQFDRDAVTLPKHSLDS